tara:strand:+ start:560 stop:1696 length:1137 start_codon:yes stop_codon:yes gene_type:complete
MTLMQIPTAQSLFGSNRRQVTPLGQIPMTTGQGIFSRPPLPPVQLPARTGRAATTQPIRPGLLGRIGRAATGLGRSLSDPNMLLGIGSGLLTGPQRIPVDFGQSLAQGLLMGKQLKSQELEDLLTQARIQGELADAAGGFQRENLVGEAMFRLPGGRTVQTFANKATGQREMVGPDGTLIPVPQGAVPLSYAGIPDLKILEASEKKLREGEERMRALDSYLNEVDGASQGFRRLMDDLNTRVKTLIADPDVDLTQQELSQAKGRKKLQGLLGRFRVPIVGGGVMTEQDALRILDALGGDFDKFQNKQVVREIISDLKSDIFQGYQSDLRGYNSYVEGLPLGSLAKTRFPRKDAYSFTPSQQSSVIKYKRNAQGKLVPQ